MTPDDYPPAERCTHERYWSRTTFRESGRVLFECDLCAASWDQPTCQHEHFASQTRTAWGERRFHCFDCGESWAVPEKEIA